MHMIQLQIHVRPTSQAIVEVGNITATFSLFPQQPDFQFLMTAYLWPIQLTIPLLLCDLFLQDLHPHVMVVFEILCQIAKYLPFMSLLAWTCLTWNAMPCWNKPSNIANCFKICFAWDLGHTSNSATFPKPAWGQVWVWMQQIWNCSKGATSLLIIITIGVFFILRVLECIVPRITLWDCSWKGQVTACTLQQLKPIPWFDSCLSSIACFTKNKRMPSSSTVPMDFIPRPNTVIL